MAERSSEELIHFMTANELLACITPGARKYIQKTINTKNEVDYQKLKKLFDKQLFEAKSFEDSSLDILTFDWQSLERDRNWWWQLQALPFLNWYANSFSLQSENERAHYFSVCLEAVHNWDNQARKNKGSPLAWHDHATAFRVRNLTNWLVFCHLTGVSLGEEPRAEILGGLIIDHLDWLQDDKHYSKHTNHGFDQAMISLVASSMFSVESFLSCQSLARARLEEEVEFAFTADGVHKENSPGYQKYMLARIEDIAMLDWIGDPALTKKYSGLAAKARKFLQVVTLPDGEVPLIGDSRGRDLGARLPAKCKETVFDYAASGYFVFRGCDLEGFEYFVLLKNQHLSSYHRHDDDLSLYVWYRGETLIGDSGLYNYQEKCPKRKFLRSKFAHSIPYVDGVACRRPNKLTSPPMICLNRDGSVEMESSMLGVRIRRSVAVNVDRGLFLSISDSIIERGTSPSIASNFVLLTPKKVVLAGTNATRVVRKNSIMEIRSSNSSRVRVLRGWDDLSPSHSGIASVDFNEIVDSSRVEFLGGRSLSFTVSITPIY